MRKIKISTLLIIGIFILAFIVRIYKLSNPIADWHSWRQADTSAVTRNFIKMGFNPIIPMYDDLSNVQSGKDNPKGYRMVEFPLYNSISYILSTIFGRSIFSIEEWQRFVSIFASLASMFFIYKIVTKIVTKRAGFFASTFFALLPYSIYYSRTILPEPLLVALSLASIYFVLRWSYKQSFFMLIVGLICGSLAILVKPYAIFFTPPIFLLIFIRGKNITKLVLFSIISCVVLFSPFILWRLWITNFPEGIPAWTWLLNKDDIRFKGSFFYWVFAERLSKLILGYVGISFLVLGIVTNIKSNLKWVIHILGISMICYVIILAAGNVQHDYYQIITTPIITMYVGIGIDMLLSVTQSNFSRLRTYVVVSIVTIGVFAFSWYQIRSYYWVNNPKMVEAGKAVDTLVPANAKVIAPYGGDTAFLYQTNRQGWPVGFEIEDKILKGASYYVNTNVNDPEVLYVKANYTVVSETSDYIIIQLR